MSEILFASSAYDKYDPSATLPAKSERLLEELNLEPVVKSKLTAVNLGRAIGCTVRIRTFRYAGLRSTVSENLTTCRARCDKEC